MIVALPCGKTIPKPRLIQINNMETLLTHTSALGFLDRRCLVGSENG